MYALYKGDEFIDIAPAKELAERLGVKESTISFYSRPSHIKRSGKNAVITVKLDDEGDDYDE